MTQLTGSEKQISWAEKIRSEKVEALQKALEIECPAEFDQEAVETAKARIQAILNNGNAGWWIDRRDLKAVTMAKSRNPFGEFETEEEYETYVKAEKVINWIANEVHNK